MISSLYTLLVSLTYIGISRASLLFTQIIMVYLLVHNYGSEEVGTYMFAVALSLPLANFLLMDAPSKILTGVNETKNLFQILGPVFGFSSIVITSLIFNYFFEFFMFSSFAVILVAVFFHKLSETVVELEIAYLKRHERFKKISWLLIKRQFFVYLISLPMLTYGFNLLHVFSVMTLISCLLAYFSILNLIKSGWSFQLAFFGGYFRREFSFAIAIGVKFFSSNVLRYFVVFLYGLSVFGYMAPAFYSLTVFSNISTVLDSVLTPRLLKGLGSKQKTLSNLKLDFCVLGFIALGIAIGAYLYAKDFYDLFYPEHAEKYAFMIVIFASGLFFYVLRAVLKAVSIKFGLGQLQVPIQFFFALLLILSLLLFNKVYGIYAPAIAYVLSSFCICVLYLSLIVVKKV